MSGGLTVVIPYHPDIMAGTKEKNLDLVPLTRYAVIHISYNFANSGAYSSSRLYTRYLSEAFLDHITAVMS